MDIFKTRLVSLYVFLFCVALFAIALYMQYGMLLEPCPLCIMQRICYTATGLVALAAFIHNPATRGKLIYGGLSAFFALAGAGFAIRQIYLQHLPKDQVPACGPSLSYMIQEFPLSEVLSAMFSGDGNCAEVVWRDPVIGMNIAEWSLVGFAMLTVACIYQMARK